jgi:HlyD family secretion protein
VVNKDHSEAEKRVVTLGRQNPDYIEVKEGLKAGEEIITSSYNNYENHPSIIITH